MCSNYSCLYLVSFLYALGTGHRKRPRSSAATEQPGPAEKRARLSAYTAASVVTKMRNPGATTIVADSLTRILKMETVKRARIKDLNSMSISMSPDAGKWASNELQSDVNKYFDDLLGSINPTKRLFVCELLDNIGNYQKSSYYSRTVVNEKPAQYKQ